MIPDDRISHLLPTSYQDMIVRVYAKKPELVCKLNANTFFIKMSSILVAVMFSPFTDFTL